MLFIISRSNQSNKDRREVASLLEFENLRWQKFLMQFSPNSLIPESRFPESLFHAEGFWQSSLSLSLSLSFSL